MAARPKRHAFAAQGAIQEAVLTSKAEGKRKAVEVDFSDSDGDASDRGSSDDNFETTSASHDPVKLFTLRIKPGNDPKADLDPLQPTVTPGKFEDIATKLQRWFPKELRKHDLPITNVRGYIRDWYARHGSSDEFVEASKRKKKLEVTLDVELVPIQIDSDELPVFDSASTCDGTVIAGYAVVAFLPEKYQSSSLTKKERGTDVIGEGGEDDDEEGEDRTLTVAYIFPSRAKPSHPISALSLDAAQQDLLSLKGTFTFQPVSLLQAGEKSMASHVLHYRSPASKYEKFLGHMVKCSPPVLSGSLLELDVGLAPAALQYGNRASHHGFVDTGSSIARKVSCRGALHRLVTISIAKGQATVDTSESYWKGDGSTFYPFPAEPATLLKVVQPKPAQRRSTADRHVDDDDGDEHGYRPLPRSASRKKKRKIVKNAEMSIVKTMAVVSADGSDQTKGQLDAIKHAQELLTDGGEAPATNSIAYLLEGCRPGRTEMVEPPPHLIRSPLLPFQKRALAWMIERETGRLPVNDKRLFAGWAAIKVDERTLYLHEPTGVVSLKRFTAGADDCLNGGILADQMGLGKTVEMLALIAARLRTKGYQNRSRSWWMAKELEPNARPIPSSATLIIVPASISSQWMTEIGKHWHGPASRVIKMDKSTIQWQVSDSRATIREQAARTLVDVDIVVSTFEFIKVELNKAQKAVVNPTKARSPLLEVLWHRVIVDEAQLIGQTAGKAAEMCNELWREFGWVSTGTPITSNIDDLHGLFAFLDHDPLSNKRYWKTLLADPFLAKDPIGAFRLRGLLSRIMWRHTKEHVRDELQLPAHSVVELGLEMKGLELTLYRRAVEKTRAKAIQAISRGQTRWDLQAILNLRQLLSHPQLASEWTNQPRLGFHQLFDQLMKRNETELNRLKTTACNMILTLSFGAQFRLEAARSKAKWKAGEAPSVSKLEALQKHALALVKELRQHDSQMEEETSLADAQYYLEKLMGGSPEPPPSLAEDLPSQLFYHKVFREAQPQDYDDPDFVIVDRDAGSEDEAKAGMNEEGERARNEFEAPTLKKNRFRANAHGREKVIGFSWEAKTKLPRLETEIVRTLEEIGKLDRDLRYLRHRRQEERVGRGERTCKICLEQADQWFGILPCLHAFCEPCLGKFVGERVAAACPVCRCRFEKKEVTLVVPNTGETEAEEEDQGGTDILGDYGTKIRGLIRDLRARLSSDPTAKAVVFSHWIKMLDFVLEALLQNGIPSVSFGSREADQTAALESFRNNAETRVLLVPMHAESGSAGLTLTTANISYLLEPSLDPGLEAQAEARIHRFGQKRPTTAVRVRVRDTLEDKIIEIASRKVGQRDICTAGEDRDAVSWDDIGAILNIDVEKERATARTARAERVAQRTQFWTEFLGQPQVQAPGREQESDEE